MPPPSASCKKTLLPQNLHHHPHLKNEQAFRGYSCNFFKFNYFLSLYGSFIIYEMGGSVGNPTRWFALTFDPHQAISPPPGRKLCDFHKGSFIIYKGAANSWILNNYCHRVLGSWKMIGFWVFYGTGVFVSGTAL